MTAISGNQKRCTGSRPRQAYSYTVEEVVAAGTEPVEKVVRVAYDSAKPGCGRHLVVIDVPATEPIADGERPLFATSAPVFVCPHCDAPDPIADGSEQAFGS